MPPLDPLRSSPSATRLPAGLLGLCLGLFALLLGLAPAAALQVGEGVTWIRLEGPLDPGMQSLLRRGVDTAKARGDRLVIELDTPGGQLDRLTQLARTIERSRADGVQVVGWVSGHALSAGALIAMVTDQLYLKTSATLGAAAVVRMGPGGVEGVLPEDEVVAEKSLSAFRAEWRAWAEQRGRPGALAAAMVDPDLEVRLVEVAGERRYVTGQEWDDLRQRGEDPVLVETVVGRGTLLTVTGPEAVRHNLADGLAENPAELLAKLGTPGGEIHLLDRTRSERWAAFFASISGLLIALAVVFVYVELQQPGIGLPGALAAVCLGLLLFGRYLTGLADVPHFVLIGLGAALILVEFFLVPGTLIAGIAGALMLFFGLVWSGLGPGIPFGTELERTLLLEGARSTILWLAVGAVGGAVLSRLVLRLPWVQRLWFASGSEAAAAVPAFASGVLELSGERARAARPGALGRVLTPLRPVGLVELDELPGERLEAQVDGAVIDVGQRVRVLELRTGRLVVEPTAGEAQP